jgi:uncharacterized protein YehS (DUF1456 family)
VDVASRDRRMAESDTDLMQIGDDITDTIDVSDAAALLGVDDEESFRRVSSAEAEQWLRPHISSHRGVDNLEAVERSVGKQNLDCI